MRECKKEKEWVGVTAERDGKEKYKSLSQLLWRLSLLSSSSIK